MQGDFVDAEQRIRFAQIKLALCPALQTTPKKNPTFCLSHQLFQGSLAKMYASKWLCIGKSGEQHQFFQTQQSNYARCFCKAYVQNPVEEFAVQISRPQAVDFVGKSRYPVEFLAVYISTAFHSLLIGSKAHFTQHTAVVYVYECSVGFVVSLSLLSCFI